nr:protein ALP1-like isoform X1 [Tanacetum cinerariifolium]
MVPKVAVTVVLKTTKELTIKSGVSELSEVCAICKDKVFNVKMRYELETDDAEYQKERKKRGNVNENAMTWSSSSRTSGDGDHSGLEQTFEVTERTKVTSGPKAVIMKQCPKSVASALVRLLQWQCISEYDTMTTIDTWRVKRIRLANTEEVHVQRFPCCSKATTAILMSLDEYMQISKRSSHMALDHFCEAVLEIYGPEFLRKPTVTDIEKLYRHHEEKHGFSGMLGSLDCTDWEWFGCPYAFKGQYVRRDHGSNPFILLEAVASQDLWIWHAFFGIAGSNNDINVLYQSPLFNDLKTGRAPEIPFVANDISYPSGYYLVDGIYPELAPLVKTIPEPTDDDHKRILYKQKQESAAKMRNERLMFLRRNGPY